MKKIFILLVFFSLLLISCKKDDSNENNVDTLQNVDEVFESISENQKMSFDLAPIELPEYIIQSDDNDSMKQKIKQQADLINQFYKRSVYPPDILFNTPKSANAIEKLNMNEIKRECFWVENNYICIYYLTANNGKLQIKYTSLFGGAQNESMITEEWKGIDGNGVKYDDYTIMYVDIMEPHHTWSKQVWLTKSFEVYNPDNCKHCLWLELQTMVEDAGTLRFIGEEKQLVTYTYITIRYGCGILENSEYIGSFEELTVYPDNRMEFILYVYSLRIKYIYKWIEYWCSPDGSWSKKVYDDYGNVIDEDHWPI